jgi:hypothetical protein
MAVVLLSPRKRVVVILQLLRKILTVLPLPLRRCIDENGNTYNISLGVMA